MFVFVQKNGTTVTLSFSSDLSTAGNLAAFTHLAVLADKDALILSGIPCDSSEYQGVRIPALSFNGGGESRGTAARVVCLCSDEFPNWIPSGKRYPAQVAQGRVIVDLRLS